MCFAEDTHKNYVIPGHVAHGVNVFNDEPIADYSIVTPYARGLNENPPLTEIGYYQPGADDAGRITADVDPKTPVATSSSLSRFFGVFDTVDPSLFNQTLDKIGSYFTGYSSATDRILLTPYADAEPGDIYVAKGVRERPTIKQWNKIKGVARMWCNNDESRGVVEIAVRNAFPNQLYTLWDIGVLNPQTPDSTTYAAPFGGLPNVLMTNKKGCGYKKLHVPFCPKRTCDGGSASCSSYVSLFYHWDDQVYGGAAANTFGGLPLGVLGGNHMVWPMSGEIIQEPSTNFGKKRLQCRS